MSVKDPVCGMTLQPEDAVGKIEFRDKTYFFCSEDCRDEFDESPEDYVESEK